MNRALLVGVNVYAKQTALNGCMNDVSDIKDLLQQAVDEDNIVVLTDREATKTAIIDALIDLVDVLEPGERGYFHFSGHGVRMPAPGVHEPTGMIEVLCPHDFDWTLDTSFTATELAIILSGLRLGARLILSFDACHSGDFSRGLGLRGQPRTLTPPSGTRSHGPTLQGFHSAARAPNVTFVSACSPWQSATDATFDGRPNGAFSRFLVDELAANTTATLGDAIAAIDKPLQDYAMTPVAENADVSYLRSNATPRTVSVRAGAIVFDRQWQATLLDQPFTVEARIAAVNGELAAFIITRAFGVTMTSPPIRVTGNITCPIHLGIYGVQIVVAITSWTFGRGTIDFVLQLDLVSSRAFVPRTRMPVHIDVTQLTFLDRAHLEPRTLTPPDDTKHAANRDPRVRVVASGVASWGPNWREDRIIRPFQDRARPEGITRTDVPQIGTQRGSGNVFVVGWLSNDETDFDFVLHIGNHFFGGCGDIDWRVEGICANVVPFPRGTKSGPRNPGSNPLSEALSYEP